MCLFIFHSAFTFCHSLNLLVLQNTVVLELEFFNTLRILRLPLFQRKRAFSHTCQPAKLIGDLSIHPHFPWSTFSAFSLTALFKSHASSLYPQIEGCFHRKVAKVIDFIFLANKEYGVYSTQQAGLVNALV